MIKTICFDMDGTIVDLYGVEGWKEMLSVTHDPTPYIVAKPLLNMSLLARLLHKAQNLGYKIIVLSWLAIDSPPEYDESVTTAKLNWLRKHLPSVKFDDIIITEYGVPKHELGEGILFDDNKKIRSEWRGEAYNPSEILDFLRKAVKV